ncbi:hypothetical protein IKF15_01575 [Candidatus Saccharibacteria bacterium]|nr:hypothetical protein [Candidatus Saccharibacteria bacterium]
MPKAKHLKKIRNWLDERGLRIKLAILSTSALLKRPRYLCVFLLSWYVILYFLSFFRDGSGNWSLLWSNLGLGAKWQLLGRVGVETWRNFGSLYGLSLVILAALQALTVIHLLYAVRHREKSKIKESAIDGASTGSIGAVIGFITLGCPSCGITMFTPILTTVAGAGAVAAVETLNQIFIVIAFILLFYTIVKLGYLNFIVLHAKKEKKDAKSD